MKRLILLIFLLCVSFPISAQNRVEKAVSNIANTSGAFLYDVEYAPLQSVLTPLIRGNKSIRGVALIENFTNITVFKAFIKNDTLIVSDSFPSSILNLPIIKQDVIYKDEIVGIVTVYYEDQSRLHLTAEEQAWIKNNTIVTLAPDPGFTPIEFIDVDGKYKGIVADYLKLIEKTTGLTFDIIPTKNWEEAVQLIKTNKAQVMGMNLITPETLEYLTFTHKFIDFPTVIIGKQGAENRRSFEEFKGSTIHVVKGYPSEQYLKDHYPDLDIKTVSSLAEGVNKVSFGEIEYFSGYMPAVSYHMEKQAIGNVKIVMTIKSEFIDSGMAVRKDLPVLRNILDKALNNISKEDKRAIHKRWLSMALKKTYDLQLTKEEKAWLRQHSTISVGGPKAFPPFNYFDKAGRFHGIAADYMKIISERIGVQLDIQSNLPWPEVLKRSKERTLDVISCTARSPERESFLSFSQPYLSSPMVIFVEQNAPFIGGLQDLTGKKVAVIKRGVTYDWLQRDQIQIKPHFVKTPLEGLTAVSLGVADAFIGNLAASSHIVLKAGLSNVKIGAPTSYDDYQLFIGVRKDWPELVGIVNKVLNNMTQDEKLRISRKWVSLKSENVIDYALVWKIAIGMGSVIIIIIIWAFQVQRQKSALQKSEGRFRGYFEHGQIGLAVTHPSQGLLEANQRLQDMLGYNLEELKGKSWSDMTHPDDRKADRLPYQKLIDGRNDQYSLDKRFIRSDGVTIYTNLSSSCVRSEKGQIELILVSLLDITERKQMENDLIEAKNKAEDATRAKGDFLANMSHEIRTPMNAIMGMTHLCLQTRLTTKQQDYLNKVHVSATSLLGLINDILDFSKIEAGKLDMELLDFRLDSVLDNVATLISDKAHEKELEFLFQISPDVPKFLIGDPLRLGQILINLANNAVKFTQVGEVVINVILKKVVDHKLTLQFTVRDTGIGLSKEQMDKLFHSFTQADASTTRQYGGTGLGLTISKRLVNLMNGDIWVESELGKGSSFMFTVELETQPVKKQTDLVLAEELEGLRVLVVDDNETSRQIFQEILESFAFDVALAYTGGKALDALTSAKEPFDLVIMDWKMPGMNGLETSRQIKNNVELPHIPKIIMCTSYGREEVMRQSEELHLDSFLIKPVNPSVLLDTILEVFGKAPSDDTSRLKKKPMTTEELNQVRGARILVVEDNDINQQVAKELLEGQGFIVDIANNGQEGVDKISQTAYDIVLMDIQMPVMGGYDAARTIRKNPAYQELPIVAMTANAMVGDRERALESGMNDHIAKPIDPKQLFAALVQRIPPGDRAIPEYYLAALKEDRTEEDENLPETLPGLDIATGVSRVGGNSKLYLNLLQKFKQNQAGAVDEIKRAVEGTDSELSVRLVHTIKGVSGNIGAMDLHEAAKDLEIYLKSEPASMDQSLFESMQSHMDRLLDSIAELEQIQSTILKENTAPANPSLIEPLMANLTALLADDDTEAKEVIEQLKPLISDPDVKIALETIEKQIDQYEFEEALENLNNIKAKATVHEPG